MKPDSHTRRTSRRVSTLLAVSILAIVGLLVAAAGAGAAGQARVIKLVTIQLTEKHPTKTTFVITEKTTMGGADVGHDTLTCAIVSPTKAICAVVFSLKSGTIKANVIVFDAPGGTGTITGGTGRYAGARGRLAYRSLNKDSTRTSVVLTLT